MVVIHWRSKDDRFSYFIHIFFFFSFWFKPSACISLWHIVCDCACNTPCPLFLCLFFFFFLPYRFIVFDIYAMYVDVRLGNSGCIYNTFTASSHPLTVLASNTVLSCCMQVTYDKKKANIPVGRSIPTLQPASTLNMHVSYRSICNRSDY